MRDSHEVRPIQNLLKNPNPIKIDTIFRFNLFDDIKLVLVGHVLELNRLLVNDVRQFIFEVQLIRLLVHRDLG